MLKEDNNRDLILYTAGSILGLFILILIIFIIYRLCLRRRLRDDEIPIIDNRHDDRYDMRLGSLRISNDVYLVQKVNEEKRKQIVDARESAYVYLRFFMRSNPEKVYLSIEHLNNIGSQLETERNWFLVKQNIKIETSEANKYRLIFINAFDSKSNTKIRKLIDIADSMSLSLKEMEILVDKFFKSIKNPFFLPFDTVDLNFDKNRVLFIQDYSKDGSLRDHLRNTSPNDVWDTKSQRQTKKSLSIKTIKEYGKQILNCLIYLKQNSLIPFDTLHSGNIILANRKKVCLLTGYENGLFFQTTRSDKMNEKFIEKLCKTYLVRVKDSETDEIVIRKAKIEIEQKRLVEIIRFGFLLVEMSTGFEPEELLPNKNLLTRIKSYYTPKDFSELENIINFIFFNRDGLHDKNDKHKNKYLLPVLEQIDAHSFFSSVKLKDQSKTESAQDPQQIEFLQYLTGKLEIKIKKLRRKSSLAFNNFANKKRLTSLKEPEFEIKEETQDRKASFSQAKIPEKTMTFSSPPPPPPPPAPPLLAPPPPPPPSLVSLPSQSAEPSDRSALLGGIRQGVKLKKTVTVDKSKPILK